MSQQINLFNPIFKQQKKHLSAATMAQALGVILLGCALLSAYLSYRGTILKTQAAVVTKQLADSQNELAKVNAEYGAREKSAAIEREVQKIEADIKALEKLAEFLKGGNLGNTDGYASYFQAFARQIVDGVWLTGISIQGAGTEVGLQGRTLNPELVATYINRLKSEPVLQGKSFSSLEMQIPQIDTSRPDAATRAPKIGYIEFSLQSQGLSGKPTDHGSKAK